MDLSLSFFLDSIRRNDALTESEKNESILKAKAAFEDIVKKRPCEKCQNPCYAPNSCEFCMKNYLEANFSQWTSNNKKIDELIKDCQKNFKRVDFIIEWIQYSNLQNIRYITEGNYYLRIDAMWIEGRFDDWDVEKQELKRYGPQSVAIKMVSISKEEGDCQWFQEIRAHLWLTSIISPVIHSYGLTQSDNDNYMIITEMTEHSLKTYLQSNLHKLDWGQKYKILLDILESLESIHDNKLIHGDLNSGVIKYSSKRKIWLISDFKFCKPLDNPTNPSTRSFMVYVAPELMGNPNELMSTASDVYSFGMLMWEVSTGYRPFDDERHVPEEKIINGHRPNVMNETPNHYSELMRKCWDENKSKRPSLTDIKNKIKNVLDDFQKNCMSPSDSEIFKSKKSISLQKNFVDNVGIPNQGKQHIRAIDYSQISNEEVADGVGRIRFATYQSNRIAIKTIHLQVDKSDKANNDELLLQLTRERIGDSENKYNDSNIVQFLGIGARDQNRIFLVIPFANGGNLRDYLKDNKLSYREKLDIAKDVATGIRKLHEHNIVHENINPKNILIFDGRAKVSNLPLPFENKELLKNMDKYIDEDIFNNIGYIDPSFVIGDGDSYKKEKSADIYSFGSLLWEIASGTIPYSKDQEGGFIKLFLSIKDGQREKDPDGISDEYIKLYKSCWNRDSLSRPNINYVREQLVNMREM